MPASGRTLTGGFAMRVKYLLAGAALAVVTLAVVGRKSWLEAAQEPVLFRTTTRVALVDMTKAYAQNEEFKSKVELMKRDVAEAEERLKVRKGAIDQAQAALQAFPPGSVKRTEAEQKLLLDQQTLQADVNLQKAKFMEQEARIYLDVYDGLLEIINAYAEEQKIDLVLRFNAQPIDRTNLQQAMQELNRQVVYHKGLDITDEIMLRAKVAQRAKAK
jgi:hypothetical protein